MEYSMYDMQNINDCYDGSIFSDPYSLWKGWWK